MVAESETLGVILQSLHTVCDWHLYLVVDQRHERLGVVEESGFSSVGVDISAEEYATVRHGINVLRKRMLVEIITP